MKLATQCPGCSHAITLARVMCSPTPLHLRCPACKQHIRASNLALPIIAVAVLAGVAIGQALVAPAGGVSGEAALRALLAVVVLELAFSLAVVNWGKLSLRSAAGPKPRDEPRR